MNLHILNHTNYANRDVQWYATLGDYPEALDVIVNANFKELDGINTTQVVNTDAIGNYLLVTDGQNNILSRWFILDSTKQREHQYLLTLRRDVIADNYVQFTTSTAYITKGYVDDVDSPLMFNDEGVKLNEIKQDELLLRDQFGGNAWYVIYFNNKMFDVIGLEFSGGARFKASFAWTVPSSGDETSLEITVPEGQTIEFINSERYVKLEGGCTFCANFSYDDVNQWKSTSSYESMWKRFKTAKLCVGQTIMGKFYVGVVPASVSYDPEYWSFYGTSTEEIFSMFDVTSMLVLKAPIGMQRLNHKSPYYIYAMPVQNARLKTDDGIVSWNGEMNRSVAFDLGRVYSGSNMVYDIQIIPFCPAAYRYDEDLDVFEFHEADMRVFNCSPIGWNVSLFETTKMLYVTEDSYTGTIPFTGYVPPEDPIDFKLSTTRKYRLNSGNYASTYEFNPAMNKGLEEFKYSVLLKPYQPYIYVAPVFNHDTLYGRDFNDARGLVCGGDYSIAQSSDQWFNYVLTNKNNEAAFNRQITSMEGDVLKSGLSTGASLAGTVGSVALSTALGGPLGAAVALPATLLAAGLNASKIGEQVTDTRNAHELNLRAIAARPDTIKNVSAWTPNAKYWPFIEVYDCTVQEKQALRKKLETDGMTINTIDQPQMFMKNDGKSFIQGELIRCNVIEPHMFNEIASEFAKGVRM